MSAAVGVLLGVLDSGFCEFHHCPVPLTEKHQALLITSIMTSCFFPSPPTSPTRRLPIFVGISSRQLLSPLVLHRQLNNQLNLLKAHKELLNDQLLALEQERISPTAHISSEELYRNRIRATRCALALRRADGMEDWIAGWVHCIADFRSIKRSLVEEGCLELDSITRAVDILVKETSF